MRQAASDGGAALLEPVMQVKISAPGSYAKDVEADIRARRSKVRSRRHAGTQAEIEADVPLGNLFKYEDNLRTITLGQCSLEMEFSHYSLLPPPDDPPFRPASAVR